MANIFKRSTVKQKVAELKVKNFDKKLTIIQEWYKAYQDGSLQKRTEGQCEQAFNNDIFKKVLGYTEYPSQPHTIIPQLSPKKGGQRADAGLGYFDDKRRRIFAVVEIKDVNKPLDRSQQREGNLTPIQQAFKYKPLFKDCRFVIATNFYEIRLFQDNQLDYEQFTLKTLCDPTNDYFELKKFILLLSAENFVSGRGKSKTEELLAEIRIEQEKISKNFYNEYSDLRLQLMRDLWKNNTKKRDIHFVTDKAQKLLDRIVFVSFCEDTGLLPDNTLHKVFKHSESSFSSVWDTLKGFFSALDSGSDKLGIPQGYNGGLFHEDSELNDLKISDDVLKSLGKIGRYDFENELTVNILGHVFEQSISDLEEIKQKVDPDDASKKSKRKKDGIFYTPEHIVDYIVQNSLGKYLHENEERIFEKYRLSNARTEKTYRQREQKALQEYQDFLHTVKVVDPACGSGAFLVKVFDYLLEENRRVGVLVGSLFSQDQVYKDILRHNIYGVDLNEESVRITQLSLWLKTAQKGKKLTYLDKNIRVGNSLINDPEEAGSKAFNWQEEFKKVFETNGFDVVVGNPPYVDSETMVKTSKKDREFISSQFESAKGNWDLFIPFIEKGLSILKNNGYLAFINPNKILSAKYAKALRDLVERKYSLVEITDMSSEKVFADADVYPIINIFSRVKKGDVTFKRSIKDLPMNIDSNDINADNWNAPLSSDFSSLSKIEDNQIISEEFNIYSSATVSDAYELKDIIGINKEFKVVNTGTIDPFDTTWGYEEMRYIKNTYLNPTVNNESYLLKKEWVNAPKIIIAGMSKRIEAFLDLDAKYIGAKSTVIITSPKGKNSLLFLTALLNSKIFSSLFSMSNSSQSMSGGYMNVNQNNLSKMPLPSTNQKHEEEIIKNSTKIESNYKQIQKDRLTFKKLVSSNFESLNWTKKMLAFWEIDFAVFVSEIKSEITIDTRKDLLKLHDEFSSKVNKEMNEVMLLMEENDLIFSKLYLE